MFDYLKNFDYKEEINSVFLFFGYLLLFFVFIIPILFSFFSSIASLSFTKKQIHMEKVFNYALLFVPALILFIFEFNILLCSYLLSILMFYSFHYLKHKNIDFQTTHIWLLSIIYLPLYLTINFIYLIASIFI